MPEQKKGGMKGGMKKKKGYGWMPDLPDQRDKMYGTVRRIPIPAELPSSVDLRPTCPPVVDQGQLNSCTGNALAGVLGFLEIKNQDQFIALSRLFIYYDERAFEHTVDSDSGAMIRDGIKTLAKKGACSEESWPYDISKFAEKPGASCFQEAATHKILEYARLQTIDEMRGCLADGYPFVFGFSVYDSFESEEVKRTGVVQMPQPDEQQQGGHAVVGVGYDDDQQRFIVRNSWGEDWGMKGYFTIPYAYLSDRNLSDDFWTIRREGGF
jgi:C1A family cysteine protease